MGRAVVAAVFLVPVLAFAGVASADWPTTPTDAGGSGYSSGECNLVFEEPPGSPPESIVSVSYACQMALPEGDTFRGFQLDAAPTQRIGYAYGEGPDMGGLVDSSVSDCGIGVVEYFGESSDGGGEWATHCGGGSSFSLLGDSTDTWPSEIDVHWDLAELTSYVHVYPAVAGYSDVAFKGTITWPEDSGSGHASDSLGDGETGCGGAGCTFVDWTPFVAADCSGGVNVNSLFGGEYGTYGWLSPNLAFAYYSDGATAEPRTGLYLDSYGCTSSGLTAAFPTAYYSGGSSSPPPAACTLLSGSGESGGDPSTGTDDPYTFQFSGGVQKVVVDPLDGAWWGGGGYTPVVDWITLDGKEFPRDTSTVSGTDPGSPLVMDATTPAGDAIDPDVWCYGDGAWVDWGEVSTMSVTAVGGGPGGSGGSGGSGIDLSTCFGASGMSLYNPVSWITGGLQDGMCVLEWLFIPGSASVTAAANAFGISSNAPTGSDGASQWLGEGAQLLATGPSASLATIQTDEESGGCSGIVADDFPLNGNHFSVCSSLAAVAANPTVSSIWPVISALVLAAFLVLMFMGVVKLLRNLMGEGK